MLLFVYGTLRRGHDNEFARLLHGASDFVSKGRVRGTLYRIAHYPGCVAEGDGWVTGEIWRVLANRTDLLAKLDEYEGMEYQRVWKAIDTPEGPVECWIYVYVAPVEGKPVIASGDWLETGA